MFGDLSQRGRQEAETQRFFEVVNASEHNVPAVALRLRAIASLRCVVSMFGDLSQKGRQEAETQRFFEQQ